uniref:DNA damage-binding protein 1 n=1 Tax=Trichuris muris TaxID=70415 RepID=A0A5S6Q394_TRIMR
MTAQACAFTLLPPTAVHISLCGNFKDANSTDLIIVKYTKIELHTLKNSVVTFIDEMDVHGRIEAACLFVPSGEKKSLLFLLTSKCQVAVVEYLNNDFITLDTYAICDFQFRRAESGSVLRWDPEHQLFGLRFGEDLLKHVTFLCSCVKPTIAYVYEDTYGCHVETLICDKTMGTITDGPMKWMCIEFDATMMFPLPAPLNGIIVVGQESVIFVRENTTHSITLECRPLPGLFCCYGVIKPGCMYVIGDTNGHIYSLTANPTGNDVKGLKMKYLCEVSRPQTLTYLGDGILFVGSEVNDSMLIRVPALCGYKFGPVSSLLTYPNIAPIVDMIRFSVDPAFEEPSFLACSGHGKDGSLRLIRAGLDTHELARIPISDATDAWCVSCAIRRKLEQTLLIVSFIFGTKTFYLNGERFDEVVIGAIPNRERTRLVSSYRCLNSSRIILVTTEAVRMIDAQNDGLLMSKWTSSKHRHIDVAAANTNTGHVVVCYGRHLCVLRCDDRYIMPIAEKTLPQDASCADISNFDGTSEEICAIGQWRNDSVILLNPLSLAVLGVYPTQCVPRSLQFCLMDGKARLFISTSNRYVTVLLVDQQNGSFKMEKTFGELPDCPTMKAVKICGKAAVFACCNQPFVLYLRKGRLVVRRALIGPTSSISAISVDAFRDSFLFCLKDKLSINRLGELSDVHFRKIALGETPIRLCHQPETRTVGVCTDKEITASRGTVQSNALTSVGNVAKCQLNATPFPKHLIKAELQFQSSEETNRENHLLIFDQDSFEVLVCYKMSPNEQCCSVLSCQLANDSNVYYIVGTALIMHGQMEATIGRLMVFTVGCQPKNEEKGREVDLDLVHEKTVNGAPYSMIEFNKKLLVAVNNVVLLFEWVLRNKKHSLQLECSCSCHVGMVQLRQVSPSSVLCGDFKQSLVLITYKPAESTLESHDIDYRTAWLTSIAVNAPNVFLSADVEYNLHTAEVKEERNGGKFALEYDCFHLGEFINVFCQRNMSLTAKAEIVLGESMLYATAEGSIGTVCILTPRYFSLFKMLETATLTAYPKYGVFKHSCWRSKAEMNELGNNNSSSRSIVDGNVIQHLLDLPTEEKDAILRDTVSATNQLVFNGRPVFHREPVERMIEDVFNINFG